MVSLNSLRCFDPSAMALLVFMFMGFVVHVSCLNFSYSTFNDYDRGNFIFTNQASNLAQGALQITPDTSNPSANMTNMSGRVLYRETFKLWKRNGVVASFNTSFVLNITPKTMPGGEGVAFILTKNASVPSNSYGPWLGIVNESENGSSSNHIVAIEFDTRKSPGDVDDNHIDLDVNGLNFSNQFSLGNSGINLSSGNDVFVDIVYDGKLKQFVINISMGSDRSNNRAVASKTYPIDISQYLLEYAYVGFSGSTSNFTELNCVKSWNFSGEKDIWKKNNRILLLILLVIPLVFVLGIGFLCCYRSRKQKKMAQTRGSRAIRDLETILEDTTRGPLKFRLKDLKSATSNFHNDKKLGQGGCGTVYKGFLKEINCEVAVKRVSKENARSEQDFIAEVTAISRLNHKNLVKLIGWCCEGDELLLVYKFMPGGSLDKLIFSRERSTEEEGEEVLLSWEIRHKIIHGVASALNYIHYGCEKRVLHRDVKASNVMLDSNYNAQLGDFGLARIVQHEGNSHHSTVDIAGTPGYIAPEYTFTGRVGVETDVYGFGVFVMEVVCGRKPGRHNNMDYIVDWVWELYGTQRLLEAVDPRLNGAMDESQIEWVLNLGLACCHPNPYERPSMILALQVLNGEANPPVIPDKKPAFLWPVNPTNVDDPDASPFTLNGGYLSQSAELSGR